jgi:hypothetical protein
VKCSERIGGENVAVIYSYVRVLWYIMWLHCLRIAPYIMCSVPFVPCYASVHLIYYYPLEFYHNVFNVLLSNPRLL